MISLTPSHIIEYLFCPRFTFFEYVIAIPQYEGNKYKVVKGREIHNEKLDQNKDYLRKKIGVIKKQCNVYLAFENLRGIVDEVLWLNNNTMASLDYKFAEYKDIVFDTYKIQLQCYSLLISKNYNSQVNKGFIVYTRSKNLLIEVDVTVDDMKKIDNCIRNISNIIENNYFPPKTNYTSRCIDCTYKNICVK